MKKINCRKKLAAALALMICASFASCGAQANDEAQPTKQTEKTSQTTKTTNNEKTEEAQTQPAVSAEPTANKESEHSPDELVVEDIYFDNDGGIGSVEWVADGAAEKTIKKILTDNFGNTNSEKTYENVNTPENCEGLKFSYEGNTYFLADDLAACYENGTNDFCVNGEYSWLTAREYEELKAAAEESRPRDYSAISDGWEDRDYLISDPSLEVFTISDKRDKQKINDWAAKVMAVADQFPRDERFEDASGTGYIIKTNGKKYEEMFFVEFGVERPSNFSNNFNEAMIPQKYVREIIDIIQHSEHSYE